MRIMHGEYAEFVARFDYCRQNSPYHSVAVEIETASGDLADTLYMTEQVASRAADWLSIYRTSREVDGLDRSILTAIHPMPSGRAASADVLEQPVFAGPSQEPVVAPWTFESHRRDCPHCGRRIMRAARLCGYCWTRLEPQHESGEELLVDEGPVGGEAGIVPHAARRP